MATLLRMPEVAAGATEAVLSEWLVEENTPFTAGDPIVTLETDKALVEVAAEADAVILRTLVAGGTTVEVGSPMALLGDANETGEDVDRLLAELGAAAPAADPPASGDAASPAAASAPASNGPLVVDWGTGQRVFMSPLARRMLKEAGLTSDHVTGSGPNGRIVRKDVERAIDAARVAASAPAPVPVPVAVPEPAPAPAPAPVAAAPAVPAVPQTGAGYHDVPHTRLRRAVSTRLTTAKQTIPHFYLKRTARIDELLALRVQLNSVSPRKISVNDLVLRAVAVAHRTVPEANVIWTDDAVRQFDTVDIAVAIASERGLVTPVLRDVEGMAPSEIARRVKEFAHSADAGALRQSDLEGGSVTVTNLGMYGVEEFSAIINPPHSAILAVGAGRKAPVAADDGSVQVATQMALVVSVDHRAIDGALAAKWMGALVAALEEPLRLVA